MEMQFCQKLLSLGGKLDVLDPNDQVVYTEQDKLSNIDDNFPGDGEQLVLVRKQ